MPPPPPPSTHTHDYPAPGRHLAPTCRIMALLTRADLDSRSPALKLGGTRLGGLHTIVRAGVVVCVAPGAGGGGGLLAPG